MSIQYEITTPKGSPRSEVKENSRSDLSSSPPVGSDKNTVAVDSSRQNRPSRVWNLTNVTLLPQIPSVPQFLYETPPTRGADEHTRIAHPSHSHLLDPTNAQSMQRHALSIFARYIQQTSLTTQVIDADIQVVWGRKLKYDRTLERARPLWDYALKGAKTQKAKRARGDYNRQPKSKSKAQEKSATTVMQDSKAKSTPISTPRQEIFKKYISSTSSSSSGAKPAELMHRNPDGKGLRTFANAAVRKPFLFSDEDTEDEDIKESPATKAKLKRSFAKLDKVTIEKAEPDAKKVKKEDDDSSSESSGTDESD